MSQQLVFTTTPGRVWQDASGTRTCRIEDIPAVRNRFSAHACARIGVAGRLPTLSFMKSAHRALVESVGVALTAYLIAVNLEGAVIRSVQPTEWELAWISDVVLSIALGAAVYLYRSLRATRNAIAERERAELVVQTQLSLAAQIQRQLLPVLPPVNDGLEVAAALESAGKIGGDFYDVIQTDPGVWTLLIADVSGKGIPAAMALGSLRSTFRAQARQQARPAQIVAQLSASFLQDWRTTLYATCIVVEFDLREGTLTYTNAGHPRGILAPRAGLRYLERGGQPLGLFPGATFDQEVLSVDVGDTCLLVTDGVTEALEGSGALEGCVMGRSPCIGDGVTELCRTVMTRAREAHGPSGVAEWEDDRTVVVVRICETHIPSPTRPRDDASAAELTASLQQS